MPFPPPVLLVDPDPTAITPLKRAGYRVVHVTTAAAARERLGSGTLVLMDVELPDEDGVVLVSEIRERSRVPVIVYSACQPNDRILALKLGADMALEKPVPDAELVARVDAVRRRVYLPPAEAQVMQYGRLTIYGKAAVVQIDREVVHVTRTEFLLLMALAESYGKFVPYKQLVARIWSHVVDDGLVHMVLIHMGRLRKRLREYAADTFVTTQHRYGYRLLDPEDVTSKGE